MTTFVPAVYSNNNLQDKISDRIQDKIPDRITIKMIIKDPGSAITHFIGMLFAVAGLFPLVIKASSDNNPVKIISMAVFMISMILMYAASTTYHTFDISERINILLKRLDHCMIPVLIAGSYTPVCLVVLHNTSGYIMFGIVWGIAVLAIAFKLLWVTCPKWISSVLYIVMGWTCVMAMPQIYSSLTHTAFFWLLGGGILYTVGGIIYAIKMPLFNANHKYFGTHEIFHLFVMAGSFCHFILMYGYGAGI